MVKETKENVNPTQGDTEKRDSERDRRRKAIAISRQESDDPIEVYLDLIAHSLNAQKPDMAPHDGLIELLEEATREYLDDLEYKMDFRYLKLWVQYASLVENPSIIFEMLLTSGIGTSRAMLYEEYATVLELAGSSAKAKDVYKRGISCKAKPLARLKKRYASFQSRATAKSSPSEISAALPSLILSTRRSVFGTDSIPQGRAAIQPNGRGSNALGASATQTSSSCEDLSSGAGLDMSTGTTPAKLSAEEEALRKHPLKNHSASTPASAYVGSILSDCEFTFASHQSSGKRHPYSHLLNAQSISGKRAERLMFPMKECLTQDGQEWSIEELRVRQLGLMDKVWHDVESETSNASSSLSATRDEESDDGDTAAEERIAVKFNDQDENALSISSIPKRPAFEPTVTLNTKEAFNAVFGMFNSPEKTRKLSAANIQEIAVTPGSARAMPLTPSNTAGRIDVYVDDDDAGAEGDGASGAADEDGDADGDGEQERPITGVFQDENRDCLRTPKSSFVPFTDDSLTSPALVFKPTPFSDKTLGSSRRPLGEAGPASRASSPGFRDPAATSEPCVFSVAASPEASPHQNSPVPTLPSPQVLSVKTSDTSDVFSVFHIPDSSSQPGQSSGVRNRDTPIFGPPTPQTDTFSSGGIFMPQPSPRVQQTLPLNIRPREELHTPAAKKVVWNDAVDLEPRPTEDGDDCVDEETDDVGEFAFRQPQGGRCGMFNVMTPITERTCEYTNSTRAMSTPSEGFRGFQRALPHDVIVDKTAALDLMMSLQTISSFKPTNPCNPFDAKILSTLLSFLPIDADHHDYKDRQTAHLEEMQAFVEKDQRRGSGFTTTASRNSSLGGSMLDIVIGDQVFQVVSKLGEGGFGAVFRVQDDENEEGECVYVALKVVRPRNAWEFYILRHLLRSLPPSLHRSVIYPRALYTFSTESVMVLDCERATLLDIVNKASSGKFSQHSGSGLAEVLVIFYAIELLRLVEGMHRIGFIHGDMKIDNCLVRLDDDSDSSTPWQSKYDPSGKGGWRHKGITLIDFGRTIDTRMFPQGQTFIGDWPTDARDCIELQECRPWSYQTDYFGLAGILYCMLFGKYMETSVIDGRVRLGQPIKRYWQVDLWNKTFDLLLNSTLVSDGGALPIVEGLKGVRQEMEAWLVDNSSRQTLKGLLTKIEIATN